MSLRIVAGSLGGRRLVAPRGSETRPTSERVREALFSILGPMDGLVVLDLFAGTGALGLEALSRGAARVVFVEQARSALEALGRNVDALGVRADVAIFPTTVERACPKLPGPFDLVLADPPYADLSTAARGLDALARRGLLAEAGRIVLEHRASDVPRCSLITFGEPRLYGDTGLSIGGLSTASDGEVGPAAG